MHLQDLEIYQLAKEISEKGWEIYHRLNFENRITMGSQFIRAIDSIGANIAEGFGRFHYLDKNKFNYNARGSLLESYHWLDLLYKRGTINSKEYQELVSLLHKLHLKLNNYIKVTKSQLS